MRSRLRTHARLPLALAVAMLGTSGLALGEASHAGWPAEEHHEGHPDNESGVLRGEPGVHNYLKTLVMRFRSQNRHFNLVGYSGGTWLLTWVPWYRWAWSRRRPGT
jgi:hypothetical protein